MRPSRRAAFSLMEVLISAAILMGSAVVLFHLAGVGTRHAADAEKLAEAQWSCRAKLDEILAGVVPIERVEDRPLVDVPGWVYSVRIEPIDGPDVPVELAVLRVTVSEDLGLGEDLVTGENPAGVEFTLARWIRDPHLPEDGLADGLAELLPDEGELR